jgi:hypothetical protein
MGKLKGLFSKSQQEQDAISQQYNQMLAQSIMNSQQALANSALQNIYTTNHTGMLGQSLQNQFTQAQLGGAIPSQQAIRKSRNPNDCEAYAMPLSSLVNLWRAKYGDKWVDVSEIDDQFWADASARLHRNKMMEETDLDNAPWARLREGV